MSRASSVVLGAIGVLATSLLAISGVGAQERVDSSAGAVRLDEVASGLNTPWSIAFLQDGAMLVTERGGQMRLVGGDGTLSPPIGGVPEVHAEGQGGLLDVVLGPDYARDGRIFFSYAEPTRRGARTAVASARLDLANLRLDDLRTVFRQKDDPSGRHHWGSRLVFAPDGTLFITLGDRFFHRDKAQTLDNHFGKIVRVKPDGSAPADNPFVGKPGALPEIWSFGHRNIQGAALNPATGVLWSHEHGPQGGDEVNIGVAGGNYGWPVITHGREYGSGARIGEGTARADVIEAAKVWIPSIAPSGMLFYTGDAFPAWRGSLLVGALSGQLLARLSLDGDKVVDEERLLGGLGMRIRDVRQGPDGLIYILDERRGRILRLAPAT